MVAGEQEESQEWRHETTCGQSKGRNRGQEGAYSTDSHNYVPCSIGINGP